MKRYIPSSTRFDEAIDALQLIVRWKFATDGRKFNGNHKEVLKAVIDIAEQRLKDLGVISKTEQSHEDSNG